MTPNLVARLRAPKASTPPRANPIVGALAKHIAGSDRRWADHSAVVRLARRADVLAWLPESRHAAYPLAWLIDSGRLSTETGSALLALPPQTFALTALAIADTLGSVRACADRWIAAAGSA